MDPATPLPRIKPGSPRDFLPPELPRVPLRDVRPAPKPTSKPHMLGPALMPSPATKPDYGYTCPIRATTLYKATPMAFRG